MSVEIEPSDAVPAAGSRVVRGGGLRIGGYAVGLATSLVSVPLLTRHLGVVDFGRYVTVTSLVMIVGLVADAGLTAVGVREYAVRSSERRASLMANTLTLRLLIASAGVLVAVGFTVLAGFDGELIAGTALAGLGLVLLLVQQTYTIPLQAELRLGITTALDLLRQVLGAVAVVIGVLAGAGLIAFFGLPIAVGLVVLVATFFAVERPPAPGLDRAEGRYLLAETVTAAAASILGAVFYRIAIVMTALLGSDVQTGYLAASSRLVEALVAVPMLIVGAAFPVLAHAADRDEARLTRAFSQLFDVSVVLGGLTALSIVVAAGPIISFLAGDKFGPSVGVLQVQGAALGLTFVVALMGAMLWTTRQKRALVAANAFGVGCAIAATAVLVPLFGAYGAALGMVTAELALLIVLSRSLIRSRSSLAISWSVLAKVGAGLAVAAAVAFAPISDPLAATAAVGAYLVTVVALRAVPNEMFAALPSLPGRR